MARVPPVRTDGDERISSYNFVVDEVIPKSSEELCSDVNINTGNFDDNKLGTNRLHDLENGSIPTIHKRGIKFSHLNIHSLIYKIDELKILLSNNPFDIICLNETLCDSSIPDSELNIDDFVLLRQDRNRHGGGIAMYISSRFDFKLRHDLKCNDLECLWVELHYPHKPPILVGSIYRPPNSTSEYFEKLDICLSKVMSENIECAIFGDFNCNFMKGKKDANAEKLQFLSELYGLKQLVDLPTRITQSTCSLIDLVFVSDPELYSETGVFKTCISDHYLVYTVRSFNNRPKSDKGISTKFRSFKNLDVNNFLFDLQRVPWSSCINHTDLDIAWETWLQFFMNIVDKHMPLCEKRIRKKACPWINEEIIETMHQRDHAHDVALNMRDNASWNMYKELKNKVNHLLRKEKKKYHSTQINDSKGNSKKMWQSIKHIIPKSNQVLPCSIEVDGARVTDHKCIAQSFNDYFVTCALKVTSGIPKHSDIILDDDEFINTDGKFELLQVSNAFVLKEIENMSDDKATGNDGISCRILKMARFIIADSLTCLINRSITTGYVPKGWKEARVIPIYKTGDMSTPNNYRPISVLPIVSKILEKAVHFQLFEFLDKNDILFPNQSGFRPLHSTATALMKLVNQWSSNIDNNKLTGVAFIDLRKAFDTVDHNILLNKLEAIGCSDTSIKWFRSYLSNREQMVCFKGVMSRSSKVLMGVPQGSILGPLLFSLYINSLPKCINDGIIDMYADDTTLTVSGSNVSEVEQKLTKGMENILSWVTKNRLVLNADKTNVMLIGKGSVVNNVTDFSVAVNGSILKRVKVAKCLGVMIDDELRWTEQVEKVIKTAQKNISVIKRAKSYVPTRSLKLLYNAIVLPHFDYCSSVWSERFQRQTLKLQKVQKRAARVILGEGFDIPSNDMFSRLGWMPIQTRFQFGRAVMMYKCLHDMAPTYLKKDLFHVSSRHDHNTRQAERNALCVPKFRTDTYKHSPLVSGIRTWNQLENSVKGSSTLNSFKYALKVFLSADGV